jgi:hypothetical protein
LPPFQTRKGNGSGNRFSFSLDHHLLALGIFGFTPENAEAGAEKIKRVKVELYCEQIVLK